MHQLKAFLQKFIEFIKPQGYSDELAFLPAALEVQQTPPSPVGRIMLWVIVLFFILSFIWAWFGKVDIVATAQGRIIPSGKSKVIQPVEGGKISAIYVKEGTKVKKGDVLVTLDETSSGADVSKLSQQLAQYKQDLVRLKSALSYISTDKLTKTVKVPHQLDDSQALYMQKQVSEFREKIAELKSQELQYESELQSAEASHLKLENTLPIVTARLKSTEKLLNKGYVTEDQYLQIKQDFISQQQDLEVEKHKIERSKAMVEQVQSQRALAISQTQQQILQKIVETKQLISSTEQDLIKAKQSQQYNQIRSPINGEVQQLAITTIGGVVTPAQELMVIVPEDQKLEIEASLLNKDIGFVYEQQKAEVKIDTFNFTKYGVIDAVVNNISRDAEENKDLGLVYAVHLGIVKNNVFVNNKQVSLSPGMQVSVEIKTGQRRIIEYLLTPLLRYESESIRER